MAYYTLSPLAIEDLRDIWRYGAERWGLTQTESYGEKLLSAFDFIAENPLAGASIEHIRAGYRKHPAGSHLIVYRMGTECVEVIRILHQSADTERHLQS
ncbi:MAG: type II toxin-antitoxin system RelE/ParE family toxin [Thiolinea sp.]